VPDLVLVPSLLSAQEDAEIAGALRLIAAAANVRMLTIPRFADSTQPSQNRRGVFAKLRGRKTPITPGGCEPAVFADQIAAYLAEAAAERRAAKEAEVDAEADRVHSSSADVVPPVSAPLPAAPIASTPHAASGGEAVDTPIEQMFDAPVEPTPIRYAPIVLAPMPASAGVEPRSLIRDEPLLNADTPLDRFDVPSSPSPAERSALEEPGAIWLAEPGPLNVEPVREVMLHDSLADLEIPDVSPAIDDHVDVAAIAAQEVSAVEQPATVDSVFARTDAIDDESQILAIEEVLQALALEDASADVAIHAAPPHDVPQVMVFDDAPVVVAFPEEPDVPELRAASEPVSEPQPAPVSRRRRKAAKKAAAESDDRFDIDALLAPLLSEIAAKRSAPAWAESRRVAPPATQPIAAPPVPAAIASPALSIESPEPAAASEFAVVAPVQAMPPDQPPVEPPIAQMPVTPAPEPVAPENVAPAASVEVVAAATVDVTPAVPVEVAPMAMEDVAPVVAAVLAEEFAAPPVAIRSAERKARTQPIAQMPVTPAPVAPEDVAPAASVDLTPAVPVEVVPMAAPIAVADVAPVVAAVLAEEFTPPPVSITPVERVAMIPPPVEPLPVEAMAVAQVPIQPTPVEPPPVVHMAAAPPVVEPIPVAQVDDIDPMFFAEDVHEGKTDPAPHDRPAWVELIESLRKDIERLKADRLPPIETAPAAPASEPEERPPVPRVGRVLSIADARGRADTAAKVRTPAPTPRAKPPKPTEDQWGLFDPEQCGFAALRAKLEEISTREEVSV
jgi:hypothetical protein